MDVMDEAANEIDVLQTVRDALMPLDNEARVRVVTYIVSLFGIDGQVTAAPPKSARADFDADSEEAETEEATTQVVTFPTFAELYAAANPGTNGEKALVAGFWLQECQQAENFTGAAANRELTELGHRVSNITHAINSMKSQNPMLILQLKKSGSSRQARKVYKVSHEGIRRIKEMIGG